MKRTIISFAFAFLLLGTGNLQSGRAANHTASVLAINQAGLSDGVTAPVANPSEALRSAAVSVLSWTRSVSFRVSRRISQEHCLARAVYFEARSESDQGQLAVAAVVLNRVKARHYPLTICGVVYQGAARLNACQFSFACDGKPDVLDDARAWEKAVAIAERALHGEMTAQEPQIIMAATHYHADYVKPKWSKSLYRLTQIGRHIFYSRGNVCRQSTGDVDAARLLLQA